MWFTAICCLFPFAAETGAPAATQLDAELNKFKREWAGIQKKTWWRDIAALVMVRTTHSNKVLPQLTLHS